MPPGRGAGRRKGDGGGRFKLGLLVAVCLVLGYGFYVQTRDFHPNAGFRQHRKELRELSRGALQRAERLQHEAEALSLAARQAQASPAGPRGSPHMTREQVEAVAVEFAETMQAKLEEQQQGGASQLQLQQGAGLQQQQQPGGGSSSRGESILQTLVEQQELRADASLAGKTGFQPLPPLRPDNATAEGGRWWWVGAAAAGGGNATSETEWRARQEAVRKATQETWAVYERYAMGADELRPLSLTGRTAFGDMAATLVDSLDTLWMLGLQPEFARARDWVAANLTFDRPAKLSLFETTIRVVGGLLSASDLSGDRLFLTKAQALADMLMPVFAASGSGLPNNVVYVNQAANKTLRTSQLGRAALAEFGSLQVEFLALSQRTGNASYGETTEAIIRRLNDAFPDKGLMPVWFNRRLGKPSGSNLYTVGAMADSYYEYLLKLWLLHGKREEAYRAMWERASDEALDRLVAVTPAGLTFVGQRRGQGRLLGKMEHLACYFPGNLALGVGQGAVAGAKAARYMQAAAALTHTCWQMYERTATGLGLDMAMFGEDGQLQPKGPANMLRPETVESLFYMWRATGDVRYREWGWRIFAAFQQHSRTPEGAFACVEDVNALPAKQQDAMESFWLAETLKYLWLLFAPDGALDLDAWVLNTEAHPLRIPPPPA